jgi:hypothetical protein
MHRRALRHAQHAREGRGASGGGGGGGGPEPEGGHGGHARGLSRGADGCQGVSKRRWLGKPTPTV